MQVDSFMTNFETIAKRTKRLRVAMGLTLEELAANVGVDYQNIQNVENGKVKRPRFINKLADALNVTEDYLIKGKESNQIDNQVLEQCIEIVAENADDLGFAEQSRLVTYLYSKAIQSNKKTTISDVTSLIRLLK